MKVNVKLFGITKDIIGESSVDVELGSDGNVDNLRQALMINYPALGDLKSVMVAVNSEYANDQKSLSPYDEIALIPPVSGG